MRVCEVDFSGCLELMMELSWHYSLHRCLKCGRLIVWRREDIGATVWEVDGGDDCAHLNEVLGVFSDGEVGAAGESLV